VTDSGRDEMRLVSLSHQLCTSNYADSLSGQGGPLGTTRAEILYANDIDVFFRLLIFRNYSYRRV